MRFWMAFKNSAGPVGSKNIIVLYLKGMLMGCADIIPGISGGTVAFITGIYSQLINTVSALDYRLLKSFISRDWNQFFQLIPARFALTLALGIFSALIIAARFIHYLMNEHTLLTWSLFFGLIAGSVFFVFKKISHKNTYVYLSILAGTIFSYWLAGAIPVETPNTFWFIIFCGAISISAMILPGISGSFILLLLGKYELLTTALKNPLLAESLQIIFLFGIGLIIGLVSFSKLVRYCLKNYSSVTLGILAGFMAGSLRKIWPWKEYSLTGDSWANTLPSLLNRLDIAALVVIAVSFILVLWLETKAKTELV